jgi:CheY-like chemotaxis protein
VAKILVADDNSNIQKMVGLALKDQGIDVVAVGNGEAAVRKISAVKPDLVLADVFMPVRNGYEVCKYVKDDSALSHIPVILLVGAFDPLDEQEAQRVGADGVLKKPFVPPDPLISMVRSALSRAGVLPSEKPAELPPVQAADMLTPRVPEIPNLGAVPSFPEFAQQAVEPVTRGPEPVRIDSAAPLAFGGLLDTTAAKEEDDLAYMPAATTEPAPERNWGATSEPQETEEEEESSWRRGGEEIDDGGIPAGGVGDWRDTVLADNPSRQSARESWDAVHAVETKEQPVSLATTDTLPAPVPVSAAKPAAAPFATDAWAAAIASPRSEEQPVPEPLAEETTVAPVLREAPAKSPVTGEKLAEVVPEPKPKSSLAENWFSPSPSPWDAELKKASELATGWDASKPERESKTEPEAKAESQPAPAAKLEEPAPAPAAVAEEASLTAAVEEAGLSSSAVEALREEAALVTESAPASDVGQPAPEPKMDDLVAKVLAKMSPDILQAVTREILKPVVEAMVRDELQSKKP